jgi:hypothetical protein
MNSEPRRFPRTEVIPQALDTLIKRLQGQLEGAAVGNDGSVCIMPSRCLAWPARPVWTSQTPRRVAAL